MSKLINLNIATLVVASLATFGLTHCGDNPGKSIAGREITSSFLSLTSGQYYQNGTLAHTIDKSGKITSLVKTNEKEAQIYFYDDNTINFNIDGYSVDENFDFSPIINSSPKTGEQSSISFSCDTYKTGNIIEVVEVPKKIPGRKYRYDIEHIQANYPSAKFLLTGMYFSRKTDNVQYSIKQPTSLFKSIPKDVLNKLFIDACDRNSEYFGSEYIEWRISSYNQEVIHQLNNNFGESLQAHPLYRIGDNLLIRTEINEIDLSDLIFSTLTEKMQNMKSSFKAGRFKKWTPSGNNLAIQFSPTKKNVAFSYQSNNPSCSGSFDLKVKKATFHNHSKSGLYITLDSSQFKYNMEKVLCGQIPEFHGLTDFIVHLINKKEVSLKISVDAEQENNNVYYHSINISAFDLPTDQQIALIHFPKLKLTSEANQ